MFCKRFIFLLIPILLVLTACSKPDKAASKSASAALAPIEMAGINLRIAKRQEVEEAFLKTHNVRFIPSNDWMSVADNIDSVMPGAEKVELAATRRGQFVFLQFIFPEVTDVKQRFQMQRMLEAKHGQPTEVDGRADRGEFRAAWDMGGSFIIQLSSGGPEKAAFLIYAAREQLLQMKGEYSDMRAKQKASAP